MTPNQRLHHWFAFKLFDEEFRKLQPWQAKILIRNQNRIFLGLAEKYER